MQTSKQQLYGTPQSEGSATPPRKVNWWLRMTSTGWDKPQDTIQQREITRRSVLLAWILLGEVIALILFIPAALTNTPTIFSLAGASVGLLITIFLNRKGLVTAAGVLMVIFIIGATMGVVVGSPDGQLHLVYLPAYDFLVVSVVVGAAVLPRSSAFVIAAVDVGIIYADLIFQGKSQDLLDAIHTFGMPTMAGRPIGILVMTSVIAFLWARGMDSAVRRADRAEELRKIELYFTQQETERTTRVEEFVQETINAISLLANGQEGMLLLPASHPWQQQAAFINGQFKQFHKLKLANRGNNEQIGFALEALLRLLQRINSGQVPVISLDPRQFKTQIPLVDEMAKYLYFMLQGRQAPVSSGTKPL
ncbi:MAG: hypothetical protein ABI234_16415 [Ktedonobacteraceae bacterium]